MQLSVCRQTFGYVCLYNLLWLFNSHLQLLPGVS